MSLGQPQDALGREHHTFLGVGKVVGGEQDGEGSSRNGSLRVALGVSWGGDVIMLGE